MAVDKDKPKTWLKYRDGFCENCIATCCTIPVEITANDLKRLGIADEFEIEESKKKLAKRLIKQNLITSYREKTGLFLLPSKPNGDCVYLDLNSRKCSVYKDRPDVCRKFPTQMGNNLGHCPKITKS